MSTTSSSVGAATSRADASAAEIMRAPCDGVARLRASWRCAPASLFPFDIDQHVDLQVRQGGDALGLVEADADFDDAGVGVSRRIDAEDVVLVDHPADLHDGASQGLAEGRTGDRRTLTNSDPRDVGLVDLGDGVHL